MCDAYTHMYICIYLIYTEEPGPGGLWAASFPPAVVPHHLCDVGSLFINKTALGSPSFIFTCKCVYMYIRFPARLRAQKTREEVSPVEGSMRKTSEGSVAFMCDAYTHIYMRESGLLCSQVQLKKRHKYTGLSFM